MHPRELFEESLPVIEQVIAHICRRAHLTGADAEDFASTARLFLMENDYEVLRRYDGRAPMVAYLGVVLQRVLSDLRYREQGRWRPSTEAKRMGPAGVLLEKLWRRDQRPLRDAAAIVASSDAHLSAAQIESMAARLPDRAPRLHIVPLGEAVEAGLATDDDASTRVVEGERRRTGEAVARVIRGALEAMPLEDRMLMKLRFGSSMTISNVAVMLRLPQRPLYRRIEALLEKLRHHLAAAGIDAAAAAGLIGSTTEELDLGLTDGKTVSVEQYLKEKAGD